MTIARTAPAVLLGALAAALLSAQPLPASAEAVVPEGPPAPAAGKARRALVLPTRVLPAEGTERSTFDLLLATALAELGIEVVDAALTARGLDASAPDLARARELYLGLEFQAALEAADQVRAAHLAHGGDLLCDPVLAEAELMMVRILLELDRSAEAKELAVALLERQPDLTLDPVDYPPAVQALWMSAVERRAAMQPAEHSVEALAAVGRAAAVDYVVAAVRKRTADGVDWLVFQIVPTAAGEAPSRQPLALGPRGTWARDFKRGLEARFGPAEPEGEAAPAVPAVPAPAPADGGKKAWYKSWWFWTSVGIVVVGGTAIGVGAWASKQEKNDGDVYMDPTQ